jgi:GDP-4-dehydro-6-deoxy-D-mannose reductase
VKALLTGALGFSARHLVARLRQEKNMFIVGSDLPPRGANTLDLYRPCNITAADEVAGLMREIQPDWVFHLAGLLRGGAAELYRVNVLGSVHILEAVKNNAPKAAVLLVGSAAEYGIWPPTEMPLSESHACRPLGPYGVSKYAVTLITQDYARDGLKVVVARPFNLIGPGMPPTLVAGAITQRAKRALASGQSTVTVGNIDTQRDFVAIEDAVDAYVRLLQAEAWGEVVNVCSGRPCSIRSLLQILLSFSSRTLTLVEDESLKRSHDAPLVIGDTAKGERLLGFRPKVELRDSLRAAWDAAVN